MTRISVTVALLCVLCGIMSSSAFVFEDCGSEYGQLNELLISSCSDMSAEKCFFPRETDIFVSMKFTPTEDVSNIHAYVFGVLLDVPIKLPVEKPEVCKDPESGLKCPLKKNEVAEYKAHFKLEKKTPAISVDVMFEFRNEKDEKILCAKFPSKVL